MSATLPNLELLSSWMDAQLVVTDYRPVPLVERILIGGMLLDERLGKIREVAIPSLPFTLPGDESHIGYLSLETVLEGHSILIFCPTKAKCEILSQQIAAEFWKIGSPANVEFPDVGRRLREQLSGVKLGEVISQLKQCPGGLDEGLKKSVAFGVAFHHAGLTYDERDIIESAFKRGVLRVIVATSTLSAGVNLPARRVIVSTPMFNGGVLDVLTYRQMCGRAGRKGVDTQG
jgi:DNA polymerase theta